MDIARFIIFIVVLKILCQPHILHTHLVHSRERGLGDVLVVYLPHLGHVGEAVGAHGAEVVAGADELVEARLREEGYFVYVVTRTNSF